MLKRTVSIVATVAVALLAFTGCDSGKEKKDDKPKEETTQEMEQEDTGMEEEMEEDTEGGDAEDTTETMGGEGESAVEEAAEGAAEEAAEEGMDEAAEEANPM